MAVTVAVQFGAVPLKTIFAFGTTAILDDTADILETQLRVSFASVIVKLIGVGTPTEKLVSEMAEMTGLAFGNTVILKDELIFGGRPSSFTRMIMFPEPVWPAASVSVAVQFGAVPPKKILASGTNDEFND